MFRLALLAAFLLCANISAYADDMPQAGQPIKEISAKETAALLDKPDQDIIIVDVRTPGEFAEGHISGAKNIDLFGTKFEAEILKLPKDKQIILYCRTGKRSEASTDILQYAGYEKAFNMADGIEAWKAAKYKIETSGKTEKSN